MEVSPLYSSDLYCHLLEVVQLVLAEPDFKFRSVLSTTVQDGFCLMFLRGQNTWEDLGANKAKNIDNRGEAYADREAEAPDPAVPFYSSTPGLFFQCSGGDLSLHLSSVGNASI